MVEQPPNCDPLRLSPRPEDFCVSQRGKTSSCNYLSGGEGSRMVPSLLLFFYFLMLRICRVGLLPPQVSRGKSYEPARLPPRAPSLLLSRASRVPGRRFLLRAGLSFHVRERELVPHDGTCCFLSHQGRIRRVEVGNWKHTHAGESQRASKMIHPHCKSKLA